MSVLKLGEKINKMEGAVGRGKREGLFRQKKIRGANEIFDKRVFAHLPLILIFIYIYIYIYIFAKISNNINVHSIFSPRKRTNERKSLAHQI